MAATIFPWSMFGAVAGSAPTVSPVNIASYIREGAPLATQVNAGGSLKERILPDKFTLTTVPVTRNL